MDFANRFTHQAMVSRPLRMEFLLSLIKTSYNMETWFRDIHNLQLAAHIYAKRYARILSLTFAIGLILCCIVFILFFYSLNFYSTNNLLNSILVVFGLQICRLTVVPKSSTLSFYGTILLVHPN